MEKYLIYAALGYVLIINIVGFLLMGIDKRKARRNRWRIKEKSFFIITLLLGGIGTWVGMYTFRHKTKHKSFVIGIPLILFSEIAAAIYIYIRIRG